jgi:hypothetical protein
MLTEIAGTVIFVEAWSSDPPEHGTPEINKCRAGYNLREVSRATTS